MHALLGDARTLASVVAALMRVLDLPLIVAGADRRDVLYQTDAIARG